jgi:hypothetical protein
MVRSRHALELALGRRQIAVRPVHIASFEMCLEFGFDHLLPQFSSAKPVRSFGGMQCRLLTARNAHCAVAPNVFHCPILARTRYYGSLQHRRNQGLWDRTHIRTAALRGVSLDTAATTVKPSALISGSSPSSSIRPHTSWLGLHRPRDTARRHRVRSPQRIDAQTKCFLRRPVSPLGPCESPWQARDNAVRAAQ